jgi:hypothetical protein
MIIICFYCWVYDTTPISEGCKYSIRIVQETYLGMLIQSVADQDDQMR